MTPLLLLQAPPASTAAPASTTAPSADDRATSFRAVEGGPELQSGERLLVYAYMAIWALAFVLILMNFLKQKNIRERIATLEDAMARARKSADKAAAEPKE